MTASPEGPQASSRPMSRVARKLAESSEEIPALPVITQEEDDAS